MKFTTERDNFADAVAWVSRTVSTRPTLPVLGGTLVELEGSRLRLASDGDTPTSSGSWTMPRVRH